MATTKTFPFKQARRVTTAEVAAARKAIGKHLGMTRPARGRPAKATAEKYCSVSIRLHPKALAWAKKEAKRQGIGYQTIINQQLLRASK